MDGVQLDADLDGRWLVPDAALLVVEEDALGNVLSIGCRSRIIPAGMVRALAIRDGGYTELENLVTLWPPL